MREIFHATTIFAIQHNGQSAMAGDGQVTFGETVIMKQHARKVRRLYHGEVLAGFAGYVADALALFERFEAKLEEYSGNLLRASVELAKEWRMDKYMRHLEAMLLVMNAEKLLLISGSGEVIEPDDGMMAIGSGGHFALAAGKALKMHAPQLSAEDIARTALEIAADICVYTNHQIVVETLDERGGGES
jgi:ATP-dependent HslUV protease subunit HslV